LRDQTGRQIHAFDAYKSQLLESIESIPAAAKEFHDFGIARPLVCAQFLEACDKFLNFLFRRFEAQVGGFPGIGCGRDRSDRVWVVDLISHLR
jgi:hypothetical protein